MSDTEQPVTALSTEAIRELLAKATPGPWVRLTHGTASQRDAAMRAALAVMAHRLPDSPDIEFTDLTWIDTEDPTGPHVGMTGNGPTSVENAALIVAVVNALPAILDELDRVADYRASPCRYCGSVNGETPPSAWQSDPMTGDALRAAINAACSLTNPRLSEVDWDAVAASFDSADYRASLAAEDGLGAAWSAVEAALPEGWILRGVSLDLWGLTHQPPERLWFATAGRGIEDDRPFVIESEACPTPTAALEALRAALIEDKPILRDTEYEPPTMKDRARARLHRP